MAFYVGGNQEFSCEICLESLIDNSSKKESLLKVFNYAYLYDSAFN